jgi:hypothetical protein
MVTMCPTRLVIAASSPARGANLVSLMFGNKNQMIGGPIPIVIFRDSVQTVPYVMDCIKSGQSITVQITGGILEPADFWVGFVGPMIG